MYVNLTGADSAPVVAVQIKSVNFTANCHKLTTYYIYILQVQQAGLQSL